MYQNDPTRVLTKEVRLSYAFLSAPHANNTQPNAEAKYSVTLLIPKTDYATKADIDASIAAATDIAVNKVWSGKRPPQIASPIHDGDGVRQDGTSYGDECKGCWVMTASKKPEKGKPYVCGIDNTKCELAPQDIYSGMYARVSINFYGYNNGGKKGIGCGLRGAMKTRDGEPLSSGAVTSSEFATVGQTVMDTVPAYGAAMPATSGAAPAYGAGYVPQNVPQNTYYPPQYPQYAAPAAAPAAPTGQINPITGLPM